MWGEVVSIVAPFSIYFFRLLPEIEAFEDAVSTAFHPTQERKTGRDKISPSAIRRYDQRLNGAPVNPEPIDHKMPRLGGRIHPCDFGHIMQPPKVFYFQEHAGRVARVFFVERYFEGDRAAAGN